jgi:hypothetical protein
LVIFDIFGRFIGLPSKYLEAYVFFPGDLLRFGVRLDLALEVDVVALLDVGRVQLGAEGQGNNRRIWGT